MIPPEAQLTKRHQEIAAWDDVDAVLKPILAHEMEVYRRIYVAHGLSRRQTAGFACKSGDTRRHASLLIIGDNGASAEGGLKGTFNELLSLNGLGALETPEFLNAQIGKFGSPEAYNHYAVGWAHALDTPYQWTKQVASHWGGTRNGTIVHWPKGITSKNETRSQFCHVIDVAPTILEAAGIPEPVMEHGVQQSPMEGTSIRYSFNNQIAAERHNLQYFEMFGNRGIYFKDRYRSRVVCSHKAPNAMDRDW